LLGHYYVVAKVGSVVARALLVLVKVLWMSCGV